LCITFLPKNKTGQDIQMKPVTILELQENSSFSSELVSGLKTCNLLRLQLLDGNTRELTNPTLGRDFVSGLLEDQKSMGHFRRSILRSIEFSEDTELNSAVLSYTRRSVGELLIASGFPRTIRFRYLEDRSSFQSCRAIGVVRGFIVSDYQLNPAIPIAALSAIEVGCE
jgi:hypothetical protein